MTVGKATRDFVRVGERVVWNDGGSLTAGVKVTFMVCACEQGARCACHKLTRLHRVAEAIT